VVLGVAAILIIGICTSRLYLGVHYPTDVVAGMLAGAAWLAILTYALTAVRFFAKRRPETNKEEHDLKRPNPV
jgi:undecaprenyl-diphosphatase